MSQEIDPAIIQKTQKSLGKYVKKPALTEKLLKKPPFRFLHDIVNVVIQETGFLKGLYTPEELKSENVKERDEKLSFLNKLIDATKAITKIDLKVRANKVIAGLEPSETNLCLQAIAKAIDKKLDSTEYVNKLKSKSENKKSKKSEEGKETNKKSSKLKSTSKIVASDKTSNDSPKSTDRSSTKISSNERNSKDKKEKVRSKPKEEKKVKKEKHKSKEKVNENIATVEETDEMIETTVKNNGTNAEDNDIVTNDINMPDDDVKLVEETQKNIEIEDKDKSLGPENNVEKIMEEEKQDFKPSAPEYSEEKSALIRHSANLVRPKSARPRSGDFKEKNLAVQREKSPEIEQNQPQEIVRPTPVQRPRSSLLRPPSVRPSSARPGAPRLRPDSALPLDQTVALGKINVIVENYDKDAVDDDEETVVIHNTPEVIENFDIPPKIPENNQGHLVEQILEQIQDGEEEGGRAKAENNNWQNEGLRSRDSVNRELSSLRDQIQSLTKSANPLGKLLNYLHEDIETMHNELELWTNTKKQLFSEISKQKKLDSELNKPLLAHLENLNQEISKQEQEIIDTRSNILRNDFRIKELLTT